MRDLKYIAICAVLVGCISGPCPLRLSASQQTAPARPCPQVAALPALKVRVLPSSDDFDIAAAGALNMLATVDDPVLKSHLPLCLQGSASGADRLSVVFAKAIADDQEMPEACAITQRPLTLCPWSNEGACHDSAPNVPTILCNADFALALEAFAILSHDETRFHALLTSSAQFIDFLDRLRRNPGEVASTLSQIAVRPEHLADHLAFTFVFLFAHELAHLQSCEMGAFGGPQTQVSFADTVGISGSSALGSETKARDLRAQVICRNYRDFRDHGWPGFMLEAAVPETEGGLPKGFELVLEKSRSVWASEQTADAYALTRLEQVIAKVERRYHGGDTATTLASAGLAFIGLRDWYEREANLLEASCPDLIGERHPLTKCMCRANANYRQAWRFFADTHPPMYLRMARSLEHLSAKPDPARRFLWLLHALAPAAVRMANWGCVASPAYDKQNPLIMYPELEDLETYPAFTPGAENRYFGGFNYGDPAELLKGCPR